MNMYTLTTVCLYFVVHVCVYKSSVKYTYYVINNLAHFVS